MANPMKKENQARIPLPAPEIPPIVLLYLNGGLFATRSAYARFFIHEIAVYPTCWF